jgi:predicted enzyme related to lactoylglutathione lyase
MKRVTGIGGVFFQAKDAPGLREWYRKHLGVDVQAWGGTTFAEGATIWNVAPGQEAPFAPGSATFMINYRVEDVRALVKVLAEEGCQVCGPVEESEWGAFGWVLDPEGNKIELWQPPQEPEKGSS